MAQAAIQPADITAASIASGPGSFTGLRISISYLKGLLFGKDIPVYPLSSLESAAATLPLSPLIEVLFDARQGRAFHARFRVESGKVIRESEDTLIDAENFTPNPASLLVYDTCSNRLSPLPKGRGIDLASLAINRAAALVTITD